MVWHKAEPRPRGQGGGERGEEAKQDCRKQDGAAKPGAPGHTSPPSGAHTRGTAAGERKGGQGRREDRGPQWEEEGGDGTPAHSRRSTPPTCAHLEGVHACLRAPLDHGQRAPAGVRGARGQR